MKKNTTSRTHTVIDPADNHTMEFARAMANVGIEVNATAYNWIYIESAIASNKTTPARTQQAI